MDRAAPVVDKDGAVVLYDIWIDEIWHGSRRLLRYAEDYINGAQAVPKLLRPVIEGEAGTEDGA